MGLVYSVKDKKFNVTYEPVNQNTSRPTNAPTNQAAIFFNQMEADRLRHNASLGKGGKR